MKLKLINPYLSIRSLPDTTLPPFTLITGLNGSGKTHLLKAIQAGEIEIEDIPKTDIRYCNWSDIGPADAGAFSNQVLGEERRGTYEKFKAIRAERTKELCLFANSIGLKGSEEELTAKLFTLTMAELSRLNLSRVKLPPEFGSKVEAASRVITSGIDRASQSILAKLKHWPKTEVERIAAATGKPAAALTFDDFALSIVPNWGSTAIFQSDFGRLFVQYNELLKTNKLKRLDGEACLTDEEFEARFLSPPWEFVNNAFKDAGLGFKISHPHPNELEAFLPIVTKISSGTEVPFSALSSGERIIMSFALILYQALDRRQFSSYPRLLLLDEVDAPLHPSMCRYLIDVVTETLVKRHGVQVIATTHSASTVAIAPEEALHCMVSDVPGVAKISKAKALNLITDGVPTLSLNYEGRRQVFVESATDAARYNELYLLMKSKLASERSLDFISTGGKDKLTGSERHTGRAAVEQIVAALVKSGNQSVFGLTDWDTDAKSTDRVLVLAEGRRYAIENVLLDPLLLLGLILKDMENTPKWTSRLPSAAGTTFTAFASMRPDELQPLVNEVQQVILGKVPTKEEVVSYVGEFSLKVAGEYLRMNGHDLQDRVLAAFPELNKHKSSTGLMMAIIKRVVREKVDYLPTEISEAFSTLLQTDPHVELTAP